MAVAAFCARDVAETMEQVFQQLTAYLPARLRKLVAPDAQQELLTGLDEGLLLFESALYRVADGSRVGLTNPADAEELARAASTLLNNAARNASGNSSASDSAIGTKSGSRHKARHNGEKHPRVLLLLPPEEFVAVTRELPGISRDMLGSALRLQTESLLPACEDALVMTVNAHSAELFEQHIALWMRQERLDTLFTAFAEEGVFLAAVRPRLLAATETAGEVRVLEESSAGLVTAVCNQGVLSQWLQLHSADRDQDEFVNQWQQEINGMPTARTVELASADDYLKYLKANQSSNTDSQTQTADAGSSHELESGSAYSFFPAGAIQERQNSLQGKRLRAGAYSIAALLFVAILPFLWQTLQLSLAERELERSRQLAANARADQAVVVEFENEWGAVSDFPIQDVAEVMFALQEALAPDQLTALDISEGLISIEGNSEDPQGILQKLEQDPLFTEVVFARATNNTRYFIDLRLSPVNFEGYFLRYFPDSQ